MISIHKLLIGFCVRIMVVTKNVHSHNIRRNKNHIILVYFIHYIIYWFTIVNQSAGIGQSCMGVNGKIKRFHSLIVEYDFTPHST